MNKQLTSILLISGTCIGAGIIALPMALVKIGVIPSIIIIILTWLFTYYCSLISLELSLNSKNDPNIKSLPEEFSGKNAKLLEDVNLILLCHSALSAYIYGCSSIFQKLIGLENNLFLIQTLLTIFIIFIFLFPKETISKINNIAFVIFISLFLLMVIKILTCINFSNIPLFNNTDYLNIPPIISLIFTSFGYQLVFYTLRDYCNNDIKMLKKAYFYGSVIPTIVYILWACGSLCVIYNNDINFYNSMIVNNIEVGDFISEMSKYFNFPGLQTLIYIISIFTIFTSIIGVGLGLKESYNSKLENKIKKPGILSTLIAILPSYLVGIIIPNAFVKILNFTGIILIIICVLLPTYLYFKANIDTPHIKILNKPSLILCLIIGIFIMLFSLL